MSINLNTIAEEIGEARKQVRVLERRYEVFQAEPLDVLQRVADRLHEVECHQSHPEACKYSSEDAFHGGNAWAGVMHRKWFRAALDRVGEAGIGGVAFLEAVDLVHPKA